MKFAKHLWLFVGNLSQNVFFFFLIASLIFNSP